jgi:hypothetical protein
MIGRLCDAVRCAQTQRATAGIHQMLAQCVVIEVAPCRSRRGSHYQYVPTFILRGVTELHVEFTP